MARTAPHGYNSNYAAILDLIRFGPAIWSCAQLKALLFHAERSTAYGKDSDRHSEKQAIEGIYSVHELGWVRGPAGLSRASWYSANRELEIDPDDETKTPDGVLRKTKGDGRYEASEYEIDWRAVKVRIARWKAAQGSKIWTPDTESRGPKFGPQGSKDWTPDNKGLNPASVDSARSPEISGVQNLDPQSDSYSRDSDSRSDGSLQISQISLELEIACRERPRTDRPATLIRKVALKIDLPFTVVQRFLHTKADELRGRGYSFNPGLLAKSFQEEIFRWLRQNERFVTSELRERDLARARAAEVKEMPPAATKTDSDFTANLLDSVKANARKLR